MLMLTYRIRNLALIEAGFIDSLRIFLQREFCHLKFLFDGSDVVGIDRLLR